MADSSAQWGRENILNDENDSPKTSEDRRRVRRDSHYYPYPYSAGTYYGGAQGSHRSAVVLIYKALNLLRRKWLTILLSVLLGLSAAGYKLWVTPRIYAATGLIEMRPRRPRIVKGADAVLDDRSYSWKGEAIINTRLQKFRGRKMREQVVRHLKESGDPSPMNVAAPVFSLIPESYLVRITCRHTDPERAALSANAYVAVAQAVTFEENKAESRNAVAWLEEQAAAQHKVLERADRALVEFRGNSKTDVLASRQKAAKDKLLQLSEKLVEIQGKLILAVDVCETLDNMSVDFDQIGKLPASAPHADEIHTTLGRWRTAVTERDALLVKYRPQHPKAIAAEKVVEVHRKEVLGSMRRARDTAHANVQLLEQQAASLEPEIHQQRGIVADQELQMVKLNGTLTALQRAQKLADISYQGLLRRIEEARLSADEDTTTVSLVQEAVVPVAPVSPHVRRILMNGILLGLMAGVGLALLKEMLDDPITSTADVETALGLRVLGVIPLSKNVSREKLALESLREGSHAVTEAFAGVRAVLCSPKYKEDSKAILVTSTGPEDGKTVVACNLAIAFARSSMKTLLIDFDLRRPRIRGIFPDGEDAESLADMLLHEGVGEWDFGRLVRQTDCSNLDVAAGGPPKKNVSVAEVVGVDSVQRFLDWAKASYDQVIIDSPPYGLISDAGVLAGQVDGVLLVCWADRSRKHSLRHATQQLEDIGANVMGVVVNAVRFDRGSFFGRYDYYHREYDRGKHYDSEP